MSFALLQSLSDDPISTMKWSDAVEREEMRGLLYRFLHCVAFFDGMKMHVFIPKSLEMQEDVWSGHRHAYCYSTLYGLMFSVL